VLVVDDEPQLLRALRINLEARGYGVATAGTGSQALLSVHDDEPDLVVLDLGLPDIDGVDVVRGLREWTTVPIVVLSGRSTSRDKIQALDVGADDYVSKPFHLDELVARIRAVSRRTTGAEDPPTVQIGDWSVDVADATIERVGDKGERLRLTPTEWHLLDVLVRNPGRLVGQRELLQRVWGPTYENETHYLRQYMARLRHKLERDPARPRHLVTEPGMGYRFQP
jgi:two-component system KDP operon response regulator KdpE